jgi:transcriptional regulator with XRE-family HTH domain
MNLTQFEFAEILGKNGTTYQRYEPQKARTKPVEPGLEFLQKVSTLTGVTIDELVNIDMQNVYDVCKVLQVHILPAYLRVYKIQNPVPLVT